MNKKTKTILQILNASKEAISTRDIYDQMEPKEQGLFGGYESVSKTLCTLKKHRGIVENGISEIFNGRTVLTWLITQSGKKLLEQEYATETTPPDATEAGIEMVEEADEILMNDSIDITETPVEITAPDQHEEVMLIDDPLAFVASAQDAILSLVETLIKQESALKITHKQEKLAVLNHFRKFSEPMNQDFHLVLTDIISDLERIAEEA